MSLINTKSLLAKLMSTENLTVEQRNVRSASFDLKNRILTIPILDGSISPELHDLFMGHEVGHALWTPVELIEESRELKISFTIVNVIEDVRIERKIKNKYPGLRQPFIKGYLELIEKDFFGTVNGDINEFNFIDRVNLYTKGGSSQGIKFNNDTEKELLAKIESVETYVDVLRVAKEVHDYLKQEIEDRQKAAAASGVADEDDDTNFGDEFFEFDDQGTDEYDSEESDDSSSGEPEAGNPDEEDDINSKTDSDVVGAGTSEEEPMSHTQETFRLNEDRLYANPNEHYYYGNVPDLPMDKVVVPHKDLWKRYKGWFASRGYSTGLKREEFIRIRNESKSVVSYLVKEFEMRKNAEQMKRASVARSGELDMKKIYAYKIADDIFKKFTVVPNGQSHGLVMFLDWSGSMTGHLDSTIKQLVNLTMFCKKVNVPFEVYAFTTEYDNAYVSERIIGDIRTDNFKLMNILSSRMSAAEYSYACSALVHMSKPSVRPEWFHLGGTPLQEAIMSAMKIVPAFQEQYKLQIVNTVFLTDGDGHSLREVYYMMQSNYGGKMIIADTVNSQEDAKFRQNSKLIIRHPKTKNQVMVKERYGRTLTSAYIQLLKDVTKCNIVGFYVLSGREFGREGRNWFNRHVLENKKIEFRKNKSLVVTSSGYDEYYLLRAEGLDTDEDAEFVVKENVTHRGLVTAFSKYAGNRLANRVVLNRFIDMIT